MISDEEIIQNWHLPERFKTYNHRLLLSERGTESKSSLDVEWRLPGAGRGGESKGLLFVGYRA